MSRYLIIGGTGFIGQAVSKRILDHPYTNDVCIFSRSESNQHIVRNKFSLYQDRMRFFIGDIRDKDSIRKCIKTYSPDIVIVSAALKRIDVCEEHPIEALKTNTEGLENVCSLAIEECIEKILYTSTDKASDPLNTYGNTKAMGEKIMMNYAKISPTQKFCITRYGNVLESTGSVIPIFRNLIRQGKNITLRGNATRFILDEKQAVDTVWDSLFRVDGPVLIPKCKAMYIRDLAEVMIEKYNKEVTIKQQSLLPCEKEHETLISENEWKFMNKETSDYYQLNPAHCLEQDGSYSSNQDVLSKEELKVFLESKGIL